MTKAKWAFLGLVGMTLVGLALTIGGYVDGHGVATTVGLIAGSGWAFFVARAYPIPAARPVLDPQVQQRNRRMSRVVGGVSVGIVVTLPLLGLRGLHDNLLAFGCGASVPVFGYLVARVLLTARVRPNFWTR